MYKIMDYLPYNFVNDLMSNEQICIAEYSKMHLRFKTTPFLQKKLKNLLLGMIEQRISNQKKVILINIHTITLH